MEVQNLLPFPTLFAFFIFLFMAARIWRKRRSNPNLPPGPWKLPIIGSLHHLIGPLPHQRLRDLANIYGPIMHLQLGEVTNIIISSPELAREVMKTHDVITAQRPYLLAVDAVAYHMTDIAFSPYGDYWRQLRKICTMELLSAKRVQSFGPVRKNELSKVIAEISSSSSNSNSNSKSPINFSKIMNSLTFKIISRAAFGKIWKGEETFHKAVRNISEEASGFSVADLYPSVKFLQEHSRLRRKLERTHRQIDEMMQNIMEGHRAGEWKEKSGIDEAVEEDFLDVLLKLQQGGDLQIPLTDDNIKAVILDMFSAGSETTSTALVWAMSELMKNPEIMKKAQTEIRQVFDKKGYVDEADIGELPYLKSIIKESLRLHPSGPLLLPRECTENLVIKGYDIPVKSRITVNAWAIGRDPNHWTEAERFYPERFLDSSTDYKGTDFKFLPFGSGRRVCPGISFGIMSIEYTLAQMLYCFDWELPNGLKPENLDMTEKFGISVVRENDLLLIPIPYIPPVSA